MMLTTRPYVNAQSSYIFKKINRKVHFLLVYFRSGVYRYHRKEIKIRKEEEVDIVGGVVLFGNNSRDE